MMTLEAIRTRFQALADRKQALLSRQEELGRELASSDDPGAFGAELGAIAGELGALDFAGQALAEQERERFKAECLEYYEAENRKWAETKKQWDALQSQLQEARQALEVLEQQAAQIRWVASFQIGDPARIYVTREMIDKSPYGRDLLAEIAPDLDKISAKYRG